MRATIQVLEDHLERRERGDIEGDLKHNYAQDVVLLCEGARNQKARASISA